MMEGIWALKEALAAPLDWLLSIVHARDPPANWGTVKSTLQQILSVPFNNI
jgi:hypothetical protein